MKAVNIKWDVSEDDMDSDDIMECLSELPNEIEIPKDMTDMDDISDYLSDLTGFSSLKPTLSTNGFLLMSVALNVRAN